MSGIVEYLKGGFQLIYWTFFKLVSFKSRIEIDPEQKDSRKYRFKKTTSLILQSLIPSLIIIIPSVFIIGCLYLIFSPEVFNWSGAAFGVAFGVTFGAGLSVALGMTGDVGFGVGLSVTLGMAFGVGLGMALGMALSVGLGVAVGVAVGLDRNVGLFAAVGVAVGMSVGVGAAGIMGTGVAGSMGAGVAGALGGIRFYFWLPELIWTVGLFLRSSFTGRPPYLGLLPTIMDEAIILPLPFLEGFIVQNYAIHPELTLVKINYLTICTNQQKLAANSRISIVVSGFDRCKSLPEITTLPDEFKWLPDPLPSEYKFDSAITELLEISKDIRAAEKATSPYRAVELLKQPLQRLEDIQKNLAFSKSRHRPTLGQITQRWLSILHTAQENYQAQAANSNEIPQAYIAGNSLSPADAAERFKGRQDVFTKIEDISLSPNPPVLLLYGGRRTGKTSSLKYLPQKVDSRLIPLLVDLQGTAISNQLSSFAKEFTKQIIDSARNRHNLRIDPPEPKPLETDPIATLQNWLTEIEAL